jgi:hypothetical protein
MKLQPEQMNYVPDCSQKSLRAQIPEPHGSCEGALTRLFSDGLFVCVLQFPFCPMIKFLISAVRLSRLPPKFISAANDIHFSGSLNFKFLEPFASEASARACHATR